MLVQCTCKLINVMPMFCNFSDLHVGSILYNIRKRYRQDQIYVSFISDLILASMVQCKLIFFGIILHSRL